MNQMAVLEKNGLSPEQMAVISIGPFTALTLIGMLQLATRHPDMSKIQKTMVRDIIDQMRPLFVGTSGEEIIRRGDHPEWDR